MPCRNAASRMYSSSPTSISMSTGSKLIRCMSATGHLLDSEKDCAGYGGWRRLSTAPPTGSGSGRNCACAVGRDVGVAFGVGHLVQEHVRALEGVAPHVVEGPQLLRVVQIEVRLTDQGLAVVADVTEIGDDVGEVLAVVQGFPFTE